MFPTFCLGSYLSIFSVVLLQILAAVLDMTPPAFSIKLAALASRKELVDLEKWLTNNLNAYKDIFYEVTFHVPPPCCYMQISYYLRVPHS